MVDRVLIRGGQSAAMRVSLPGYDVQTANISQLAFDARFANLLVYRRGTVAITGSGADNFIPFGETLDKPPLGFFIMGHFPSFGINGQTPNAVMNYGSSSAYLYRQAITTTTGFYLKTDQPTPSGGFTCLYVVFKQLAA